MNLFGADIPVYTIAVILAFFFASLIPLLLLHLNRASRYLQITKVPVVPGARVVVGHMFEMLKAEHLGKYDYEKMKTYGSVFGVVEFSLPVLVVSDPEILKEVLVRQFSSFTDRRALPMRGWMKLSMFDQRGAEWKRLRTMMTPFFSMAKLKHNFVHMDRAADTLVGILGDVCDKREGFDAEQLSSAFAIDVIFASAFSIHIDSQKDPNDPFLSTVRTLSNIHFESPLIFLAFAFPCLSPVFEKFGITMFPAGYQKFFEKAVKKMIDDRLHSDDQEQTADFIKTMVKAHLMEEVESELRKTAESQNSHATRKGLTDIEIVAQCLLFVLAGWSTTAATLSFLLHNLAVHQDVQDRAVKELNTVLGVEGKLTYDAVSKLEYLDQCLSESLRIFPIAYRFDRECSADVTIGQLRIPEGCYVGVPIWAMNHDPNLWPDPEKFDPDRFSPELRDSINPYVNMPFGVGSRSCIGNRFAQLEVKLATARILREFRVVTNSLTRNPVELQSGLFVQPKNGLPLSVERRRPL